MKQVRYRLENRKIRYYINKQLDINNLSDNTFEHGTSGFMIRNMKHPKIKELNNRWYSHIVECSIQCQIVLFFVKQYYDCIHYFKETPFVSNHF
jgi:hypothetical protein